MGGMGRARDCGGNGRFDLQEPGHLMFQGVRCDFPINRVGHVDPIMNTSSFSIVKRLAGFVALGLAGAALLVSSAHAQNNLKPSVVVLDELVLPPIDADGNAFFDLPAPEHLSGSTKGRYRAHFVLASNANPYSFVA